MINWWRNRANRNRVTVTETGNITIMVNVRFQVTLFSWMLRALDYLNFHCVCKLTACFAHNYFQLQMEQVLQLMETTTSGNRAWERSAFRLFVSFFLSGYNAICVISLLILLFLFKCHLISANCLISADPGRHHGVIVVSGTYRIHGTDWFPLAFHWSSHHRSNHHLGRTGFVLRGRRARR